MRIFKCAVAGIYAHPATVLFIFEVHVGKRRHQHLQQRLQFGENRCGVSAHRIRVRDAVDLRPCNILNMLSKLDDNTLEYHLDVCRLHDITNKSGYRDLEFS